MSIIEANEIKNLALETPFQPTLSAAIATTSGTEHDFAGIPSWVSRLTLIFDRVSTDGTDEPLIQLGVAGGPVTSGYDAEGFLTNLVPSLGITTATNGFPIRSLVAAHTLVGHMVFTKVTDNVWIGSHTLMPMDSNRILIGAGTVDLAGALTQLRLTTSGGTDLFDGGQASIMYE